MDLAIARAFSRWRSGLRPATMINCTILWLLASGTRRPPPLAAIYAALMQPRRGPRCGIYIATRQLLECDLGKASELARMQAFPLLGLKLFQRLQANLKVLADALPVEFAGHASELDFTMKRLVRDAK